MTIPWSKQIQKTKKNGSFKDALGNTWASPKDVPFILSIVGHAKKVYNNCTRGCLNCSCFFSEFVGTTAPPEPTAEMRLELLKLRAERAEKEQAARIAAGLVTSHHLVFFTIYGVSVSM